ncbi:MAG: DUF4331 family protein [Nannocystaceae bacterium]
MKTLFNTLPLAAAAGLVLMGCPSDDAPPVTDDTGSTGTTATTTMTPPMTTVADSSTTVDPMTTTGSSSDTGETTTGGEAELPEFGKLDPDAYTRVDRMGFPAINTGLIIAGDKDAYNAASPADDAALAFATDIFTSLEILHIGVPGMQSPDNTGLDDDLAALTLQPCVTPGLPMDTCDDQGGPFAIPDVITIEVGGADAFPNGRRLADPVMDIVLAVLLLDLSVSETAILTFLDLDGDGTFGPSLNPLENDLEFNSDFPYVAAPHTL